MDVVAAPLAGLPVKVDEGLAVEFEARLADSSSLAFRVAYSVLRHREDAEDVAQDAFARAYRSFHALRDREKFRAWLVRMTWRLALDHRRAAKRRLVRDDAAAAPLSGGDTQEATLLDAEQSARLWKAIDALPDKYRVVVVLAAIEEQGLAEVGALLDIPEGTVKSRLFQARKMLQEQLR
jgi:RNA polymerase sigma-70 factor (ECF subfamily)